MARKTFISYKYSDARWLRDRIIGALGNDAAYYKGEDGYTKDMSSLKADTIKEYLKNMIYDTSVMIVVISPEMTESDWIPWEIEYALKDVKRGDRCSHSNGIVGVVQKVGGGYTWLKQWSHNADGCTTWKPDGSKLPAIIRKNRGNQTPKIYACERCKSIDWLNGSYIALVEEDDFLSDPARFIENAYDKSQHLCGYVICKQVS